MSRSPGKPPRARWSSRRGAPPAVGPVVGLAAVLAGLVLVPPGPGGAGAPERPALPADAPSPAAERRAATLPAEPAEAPPPADRPARDPAAARDDLAPRAAAWRRAVVAGDRRAIVGGALALRRAPDGRAQLLALAGDAHPRVRAYALRELGRRRDVALEPVFRARLDDPSPPVRENARWALSELAEASK